MARGTVCIESTRCKGCGLCIAACPQHVLAFSTQLNAQGYHPVTLVEEAAECTGCGRCALVCPDVVFRVYREPVVHRPRMPRDGACAKQEATHERTLEG